MRRLLAFPLAGLAVLYGAVAVHLFIQEKWVLDTPPTLDPDEVRNPEVALGLAQSRFERNRFREEELELVLRALRQA
ncbi:MAG TPA: hypothetical protein VIE88_16125, partial [Vicinamibacteria bacterium]